MDTQIFHNSLKGVKFVTLETDVLWLHIALGHCSAHLPFSWSSRIFLIVENISVVALSLASFD
jgi:hypothetical protein